MSSILFYLILIATSMDLTLSDNDNTTALIENDDDPPSEINRAVMGQFPWHVAIVDETRSLICGGSIITSTHILTSAHCTLKFKDLTKITILRGCLNFTSVSVGDCQSSPVKSYINHPFYDGLSSEYDISVIEIEKIEFTENITNIRLTSHDYSRNVMRICGFDNPPMLNGDPLDKTLLWSDLNRIDSSECSQWNRIGHQENIICLDTYLSHPPCEHDAGGGIFIQPSTGEWLQLGVISQYLGDTCTTGNQVVGVNLDWALDWIDSVLTVEVTTTTTKSPPPS